MDTLPELIRKMVTVLHEEGGVGIAAPQVNVTKRVFIAECSSVTPPLPATVFVNPHIDIAPSYGLPKNDIFEGCLSIPEYRAIVPRYPKIKMTTTTKTGKTT